MPELSMCEAASYSTAGLLMAVSRDVAMSGARVETASHAVPIPS